MSEHGSVIAQRFRSYFIKVLLWIPVAGLLAALVVAGAAELFEGMPNVVGGVGVAAMLFVVGGALNIHRRNVRCPACSAWVMPVGFNGFVPARCPKCSADFR